MAFINIAGVRDRVWFMDFVNEDTPSTGISFHGTVREYKRLRSQGVSYAQWSDRELHRNIGELGEKAGIKCFVKWQ